MICPCKGCTDRTLTCHGFCKRYKDWKQEREEINQWLRSQASVPTEGARRGFARKLRRIALGRDKWRKGDSY